MTQILSNSPGHFVRIIYQCLIILSVFSLTACEDDKFKASEQNNSVSESQISTISTPVQGSNLKTAEGSYSKTAEGSNLKTAQDSYLKTAQDYSKTDFKILDFAERDYKGVSSLGIVLSVPLDSGSGFQQYFVLERRDGERVDGAWILSANGKELFFKNIEPEKEYLLTVYANLKAVNDQQLEERYKKNLTTKAIESSVTFAHEGGILPLTHSKGLPVYSINIKQVDIEFHRVKADKIMAFLDSWSGGKKSTYQLKKYAEKSELVYSARFDLPVEKNKRERVILSLNHIDELKTAGIYLAVMKVPGHYDYRQSVTYFIRSDIGVHVRRYPGKLDVYLRSLITGDALESVKVSLLDGNSQLLTMKTVDKDGLVSFADKLKRAHLILAQKDQQISLVRLNSPALDLSEFNVGTRTAHENEAFIYAPRDLYRPGEKIEISMLLRNSDGQPIPGIPLKAVIKREDGQIVERFTWHAQKLGYYYHAYQLANNVRTGLWYIEVQLPGDNTPRKWTFLVEDFLPERMKLTLQEPDEGTFVAPDKALIIPVDGQYLYGAPASGNRLETTINTYIDQEAVASLPGYLFGLAEEDGAKSRYELDAAKLDEQGKLDLIIPSTWKKTKSPIAIKVTSSLFETGGRAVKRQAKYRVWPDTALIGIRPHSEDPQANTLLKFDIVNADKSGQLQKAEHLQVTLIKKRRDYYWSYNDSDDWQMEYSEKQYPVLKQNLAIIEGEKFLLEVPVEWGEYRLEIHNPDNQLTTSIEFNAGGSWYYDNEQAKITRPDKVNLVLNKEQYKAGDIAQILIKSPFIGKGIILVENNEEKLWQKNIDLKDSNEIQLDIPVSSNWQRHDIYISAVFFNTIDTQKGKTEIKRALGLIHLPLDRTGRQINFTLDVAAKSKPFSMLPVTIKLDRKSLTNTNTSSEIMVTLAAVDVGVLNVSNFDTPDPFSWFFSQRRYAVDSLDLYGNIIDGRKGIIGKQRFGGDMDVTSAGNLQKAEVKIVSLFHQPVLFDAQGIANIALDIPDFNGQLRLMAVAFNENSFGQAEQDIIIAAPLVTQLSMPRFLAANDQSQVTLDIHNLSEQEQSIQVELSSDNMIEILQPVRQLSLKDGEKTVLHFVIKSQSQFGLSDIVLSIKKLSINSFSQDLDVNLLHKEVQADNDVNVHRQWQLAVRPAWPAVIRNEKRIIDTEQSINLKIKTDDLIPETLSGELLISNQPPINLSTHLSHLLKYPYGCLEQTTSSSFPWLLADKDNMALLGLKDLKIKNKPIDFSKRKQYLSRGVQKLSAKQLSNGGFGLWSNQSSEEMWLSVYASHFLIQAKEQGVDVPGTVLKPAVKRLQQYLRSARPGYNYRYSQHPEHLTLAYKAYAAYVLASLRQAPLGTMRTLYDYHRKDTRSGLPLMHLGIALSHQGDRKRGAEAITKSLTIEREEHSYLGDYGSALRDVSLMLEALVRFQPSHDGINTLLINLQDELSKRQWLSTQERNALFMTGVALKQNGQKQWQALITTALEEKKIIHEGDFKQKLVQADIAGDITSGIKIKSLSGERLYAGLDVSGYTKNSPEPDFTHFNITRTYYNTAGEVILPDQVAVGELMIVELSLQAKNRIQDALVIDLIPAGFEIENQNLEHSIKLDNYRIGSDALVDKMSSKDIKYQAWRDDRYVAAIDIKSYGTQRLYYLLRAVTPGRYQVPPPYAEDMYRPYIRAIGQTPEPQTILNRNYQM